ncbi:MAG: hypothetical protein JO233_01940 [Candidatus Eremiobacteraeota bacterium]|nr:hypothetical protein [Candidatus Eremiobacteraeota bacterium]
MKRIATILTLLVLTMVPFGYQVGAHPLFTDRQIFEGVVLGSGPVRNLLPARALPTDNMIDRRRAVAFLEREIQRTDRHFFAAFASAATSGDPGLLSGALNHTKALIQGIAGARVASLGVTRDAAPTQSQAVVHMPVTTTDTSIQITPPIALVLDFVVISYRQQGNSGLAVYDLARPSFAAERGIAMITRALDGVSYSKS